MFPLFVMAGAAGLAALSQRREERYGYGEGSLGAKLGPELVRHNLSGIRGRPLWWRTPSFGADTRPWVKAVDLASSGRNLEAKALFKSSYPDLAREQRSAPGKIQVLPPYHTILGLGDGISIDPVRASRRLLEIYPELQNR